MIASKEDTQKNLLILDIKLDRSRDFFTISGRRNILQQECNHWSQTNKMHTSANTSVLAGQKLTFPTHGLYIWITSSLYLQKFIRVHFLLQSVMGNSRGAFVNQTSSIKPRNSSHNIFCNTNHRRQEDFNQLKTLWLCKKAWGKAGLGIWFKIRNVCKDDWECGILLQGMSHPCL